MTDMSALSASEAVQFLEWLDPVGLHNLVALDPAGVAAPEAITASLEWVNNPKGDLRAFIEKHNGDRNLYFSINAPSAAARHDSKLRRDEIGAVRAFAVDLDEVPDGYPWGDPVDDYVPSAVIDSGGGRWALWKLAEPLTIGQDDGHSIAAAERQNSALAAKFGADRVSTNIDRIARLPGTLNIPNAAKRKKGRTEAVARLLNAGPFTYDVQEIAAWCPPLAAAEVAPPKADQTPLAELDAPASVAKAARWLLLDAPEAVEGEGGNAATYQIATRLKDFGVSRETAFDLLLDGWNESKAIPPWPAADLLGIVRNAYAYGTAAPARNAGNLAETEFEAVEIAPPAIAKRRMAPVMFADIKQDLKAASRHLIEGWYDQQTMIVTYGESNSGKTHVVLDQALAIAAGRQWAGRKTHQGLVVYVAAEGGFGLQRRVMAHRIFRPEHADLPFALIPYPINLMHSAADAKELISQIKALESASGVSCVMVVIDTLSRALAGGDENSSADMGAFVKRCDEIRAATGAALHVIHHAGKNTAKGARGHSLLRAAVDTEIEIENGAILCRKQRDMEGARELRFQYKPVVIGQNAAGEPVGSVVLDVWETTEFDTGLTPQTQKVMEAAEAVVSQKTQNVGEENAGPETPLFTVREVETFGGLGFPKTTVDRAFAELTEIGVFAKCKRGLYKFNRNPKTPTKPQA